MTDPIQALSSERYINLETFRKDGSGVKTPVWFAELDESLVVFTNGHSYKVKRLRRSPKARVAACNVRGSLRGPWHDAEAVLVDDRALFDRALGALRKKYGWQMLLADIGGRLRGSKKDWEVIRIAFP